MATKDISRAAAALGRKGRQANTDAQAAASRANGAKGGRPRRIDRIERDIDGWWIYLKPGWVVCDERTHAIVEETKQAALRKMSLVEPCACDECRRLQGGAA